jgi:hypothetical protein
MSDGDILEAARSIRQYLHQLIPEGADAIDKELAEHLKNTEAGKNNVNSLIIATLRKHEPTREWLAAFLKQHEPPEVTRVFSFQGSTGDPVPIAARKYVCVQGDYNWYRMSAGTPIPLCPTHGLPLVASP